MAHEEEQEQYESDCHDHKKAWHLWQIRANGTEQWVDLTGPPAWDEDFEYRRIEPQFQPECFSGLNWQEALEKGLVEKVVEFSRNGDSWCTGWLTQIKDSDCTENRFVGPSGLGYTYIRTCPKTHQHPTITIGDKELPRPEVDAPGEDTKYWLFCQSDVFKMTWCGNGFERCWLKKGMIHLKESRAQAWASWWSESVISAIKGHGGHTNGD